MPKKWYTKACEDCGTTLRIHEDWDSPPKLCKSCSARAKSFLPLETEHYTAANATTKSGPAELKRSPTAIEVFFSYSHIDEKLRNELDKHLTTLRRSDMIRIWNDREIGPGTEFQCEIAQHLETAELILLLISANFLSSEYCYSKEMNRAMQRQEHGEARVIPIILRPVDWHDTPFGKLIALPQDGKPVTTWTKRDLAFLDVVKGIRKAVEQLCEDRTNV
jgi:hypothetical protein